MLYLIGLGLDKNDITLKGMEAIRNCQRIYLENYTSYVNVFEIERIIGMTTIPAARTFVEDGEEILKEAKKKNVALLVLGDPLSATTHIDLVLRAKKQKINVKIVHSVSIFNAIAECGLQLYKFGKTASIPKWQANFRPESFYDMIIDNLGIKAHTLLLLDIGLSVNEALEYIEGISKPRNDGLLNKKIIVCEKVGTEEQKFTYNTISSLIKKKFNVPACIIVPSELHFVEEEALKTFK